MDSFLYHLLELHRVSFPIFGAKGNGITVRLTHEESNTLTLLWNKQAASIVSAGLCQQHQLC